MKLTYRTKRGMTMALGFILAGAACHPFFRDAQPIVFPAAGFLIGLGLKAFGHGKERRDAPSAP